MSFAATGLPSAWRKNRSLPLPPVSVAGTPSSGTVLVVKRNCPLSRMLRHVLCGPPPVRSSGKARRQQVELAVGGQAAKRREEKFFENQEGAIASAILPAFTVPLQASSPTRF